MRRPVSLLSMLAFVGVFGVACSDPLAPDCISEDCAVSHSGLPIGSNNSGLPIGSNNSGLPMGSNNSVTAINFSGLPIGSNN